MTADYRHCFTCGFETLHNGDTCRFCEPVASDLAAVLYCSGCEAEITEHGPNRKFCSRKCRNSWWEKHTDAGREWIAEKNRRRLLTRTDRVRRQRTRAEKELAVAHGTFARFDTGCRCPRCKGANAHPRPVAA